MVLEGGPCTVMRKRRGQSAVGVCGDTISGAWYAGPTCKACYERGVRAKNRAKKQKRNQTEEDEVDMTGDIVLKVLKISGSRCAHSNSARPGPHRELTVDRIPRRCRFSLIPSTLGDRSNPPPDSDDSDDAARLGRRWTTRSSRRLACSRVCAVVSMSCPDMSDCHVSVMSVWGVILSLLGKCRIVSCSALQACGWACVLSDPLA